MESGKPAGKSCDMQGWARPTILGLPQFLARCFWNKEWNVKSGDRGGGLKIGRDGNFYEIIMIYFFSNIHQKHGQNDFSISFLIHLTLSRGKISQAKLRFNSC